MRLTVVGCSGSLPGPDSPASCYLLRSPYHGRDFNLLLDLGSGALGPLQRHIALSEVDAVLLSHLHADHCLDLCGLYVALRYGPRTGEPSPIPVFGPSGAGHRLARSYAAARPEDMGGELDFRTLADQEALRLGPFSVTPYAVRHPVEAFGFRVEADGAVLAYTGDTDSCPALGPLAARADLLLADSAFVDGRDAEAGIHLSGSRAAQAAKDAGGVKRLLLTHIPPWNDPEVCRAQAGEVWGRGVELAAPGATYQL